MNMNDSQSWGCHCNREIAFLQKVQIDFAFSTGFNELDIINCVVCWWTFIKNNWLTVNSRKLYLPTKLYQSNFQGLE